MAAAMVYLDRTENDSWNTVAYFYMTLVVLQPNASLLAYWLRGNSRRVEHVSLFMDCFWAGGAIVILHFGLPSSIVLGLMSLMNVTASRGIKHLFWGVLCIGLGLGFVSLFHPISITFAISEPLLFLSLSCLAGYCILFGFVVDKANKSLLRAKDRITKQKNEIEAQSIKLKELNEEIGQQKEEILQTLQVVETQRNEIQYKNENIVASINYAKRIQQAMLPPHEVLTAAFKDIFVLFLPKDIVSGDFYWFTKTEQHKFLAVADCTGHGVPGAFMTLISNTLLNQIINENEVYAPAAILAELDKAIISTLKQDEEDNNVNDGMDICLLCYTTSEQKIRFSSAKRPFLLLRNHILTETKGSRFPIGSSYGYEKVYEEHLLDALPNDKFYLYTDGYPDQFGEQTGRKLLSKHFKEMIGQINTKPFAEQKLYLEGYIQNWRGEIPQTDDVLVVGLEL